MIGSNLGGIAELVKDKVNGFLVPFNSPRAWRDAIEPLSKNRGLLSQLKTSITEVRKMETVANEMEAVYRECISLKNTA